MRDFLTLGLLGHPLSHSLSPVLHAAALQYAGLEGRYLLFDVPPGDFEDDFTKMLQRGIAGFNVTIPYKQRVREKVHELTQEATQTGAVNTVKVTDEGNLAGHNTDVKGFEFALTELMHVHGIDKLHRKTALVIGAGGAARAAIVGLHRLGLANIKIRGRDLAKADTLVAELTEHFAQNTVTTPRAAQIVHGKTTAHLQLDDGDDYEQLSVVVNASPIGLLDDTHPEWLPALVNSLSNKCLCFDMVYHKDKTSPVFTKLAQQRELPVVDGLPMLVHQARLAFEYWIGVSVPYEVMYESLLN